MRGSLRVETDEEKAALQRLFDNLQKTQDASTHQNQLLTARLNDKVSELERLSQQLNNVQSNLEHYREAVREERVIEKRELNGKIAGLENTLEVQQAITTNLNNELTKLKHQYEISENTKNTAITEREDILSRYKDCEMTLHQSTLEENKLREKHAQLTLAHHTLQSDFASNKAKLNGSITNSEKYKTQAELLDVALKNAEDKLATLGDKVLFLTQEKTELSCQLKQVLSVS